MMKFKDVANDVLIVNVDLIRKVSLIMKLPEAKMLVVSWYK